MEIDQLKSAAADQMEMMMTTTMMQVEKVPDFYGAFNDIVHDLPPAAFTGATSNDYANSNLGTSMVAFADNPPVDGSSSFINMAGNEISFSGTNPVQDPGLLMTGSSTGSWRGGSGDLSGGENACSTPLQKRNSMAAMREIIFRIAAMQPIHIDPESVKPPKRRNVKISKDPQSVAARHRRERISERIRILQRLVPGGTKMDTASMLDEAIHYVKFLKTQVQSLERAAADRPTGLGFPVPVSNEGYLNFDNVYQPSQDFSHYRDD